MLLETDSRPSPIAAVADAERLGEWNSALTQYQNALQQAHACVDFPRAAELLRSIGRLHFERGDYERAAEVFRQSLTLAETAGTPAQRGAALNCLGVVEQFRADIDAAQDHYRDAAELAN